MSGFSFNFLLHIFPLIPIFGPFYLLFCFHLLWQRTYSVSGRGRIGFGIFNASVRVGVEALACGGRGVLL